VKAKEGDEKIGEWSHQFNAPESGCLVDPAGSVVFTAPTCDKLGYYTITAVTGISYFIGEDEISAGVYTVNNGTTVEIEAKADQGYYLTPGATSKWSYTFTALTNCVTTTATTTTPTKLPVTSGDSTIANVTMLSAIAGVITVLGFAARSILVKNI